MPGDDIDELVSVMADEGWEREIDPLTVPLLEALASAGSYEQALAALAPAFAAMDSTALGELLERAGFAVRLAADSGADGQL